MSSQPIHLDERTIDSLCSAYRAAVEVPPYDATDQAMLRAAARGLRSNWVRPAAYAAALLAATIGLVLMFAITASQKHMGRTDSFRNITRYFLKGDRHGAVSLPRRVVPHDVSQSAQGPLLQRPAQRAPTLSGCAAGPCGRIATPPASGAPARVSGFLVRDLKDAQAAMNARDYDKEITALRAALAARGKRSAYDDFLINSWLGVAYVNQKDYAQAAPVLEAAAESQYALPAQRGGMLGAVVGIYSQLHQYSKAIEAAQIAIQLGVANPSLYVTMAVDEEQLGQPREAAQTIQHIIDSEPKPEEKYLLFQWDAYTKGNDMADAARVAGELCLYYRRPGFCGPR